MTLAKTELFSEREVMLAAFAKSMSHPARIAIVGLLQRSPVMSCNELVKALPLAQATVSQHLKVLREAGIVEGSNCGTQVCYRIVPDQIRDFCFEFRTMLGQ